jgi:hypothetical protein
VYCAGEKGNISEAIASINQRTLSRVTQNVVKGVNACFRRMVGTYSIFYELYFRFYCIVVLRSEHPIVYVFSQKHLPSYLGIVFFVHSDYFLFLV